MPPQSNRLAPRANALASYIPMPTDPRAPQVAPRLSPGQYAQNVSAGLGYGLTNQLRGVEQLVRDPVTAFKEQLAAIGQFASNPAVALQMLRELRQRAAAGPIGFGEVTGELLPTPGRRPPSNALRIADLPDRFPRVDSIESMNVGPMRVKPRVIAEGKPLYRETSADGLGDYLRLDKQFEYGGGFVTDDPNLAIGQGFNTGVMLRFRPNALSGEEHIKPGTGIIGGREYRADIIAPRAVDEVVLKNAKDWKRINALVKRNLTQNFTRATNPDGSVTFTRKTQD
jgi:hypothetical protein